MSHRASKRFWREFQDLPPEVQQLARENYDLLKTNLEHPSLHFKRVGRFWSARVGLSHRALGFDSPSGIVWFWIGPHEEYVRVDQTVVGALPNSALPDVDPQAGPWSDLEVQVGRGSRMTNRYEIIIFWSDEDQAFIADVPELPGCMAHGPSHAEALVSAQEAISLWLDTARAHGDAVPEPKGRRLLYA